MSQAKIETLQTLLARVQQRRQEPRLVSLPHAGIASANTNVAAPALELAKGPSDASEARQVGPAPRETSSGLSSVPPPSIAPPAAATRPALRPIEDAIAPSSPSSVPPPSLRSSTPPPRTPAPPRAPTEVLPAAEPSGENTATLPPPARVAPSPAVPFDSAVRVTSAPRIDAAKTFGELLELSLALRPKAG